MGAVLSGLFETEDTPSNTNADNIPIVTTSNTNGYAVLVAELAPIGDVTERPIRDILVENLREELERATYLSKIRTYSYPEIITSNEEAQEVALANNATVIIWGRYDQDAIQLNIQVGSTVQFPDLDISLETVENTVNVRARLQNENLESIAPQVLGILTGLQSADGNAYEVMRTLAIMDDLNVTNSEVVGDTVAAHVHRYYSNFFSNPNTALSEIDAAQHLDPSNPLLYIFRGGLYMRRGEYDKAGQDAQSAHLLEPEWAFPIYIDASENLALGRIDATIEQYSEIIALNPDDWFSYNFRGVLHYIKGDYAAANIDYTRSIELGPTANFPYPFLVMLALREGDIFESQRLMNEVRSRFSDPSIGNRTINATFGDTFPIPFGPWLSAFGNLVLGQFDNVIADIESIPENQRPQFPELYIIEGLAYCNLQQYDEAMQAYSTGIELAPDVTIAYLLRGEIALRLGDQDQVAEDTAKILESDLSETLAPYLEAGINGELSCENFFTYSIDN